MKPRNTFIIALILSMICIEGCQNLSTMRTGKETDVHAVITNIGRDDLGRVMIFAETKERSRMVFVKDIYSSSGSSLDAKRKIREYIDSIKKYVGRQVVISYCENGIGDLMITGIKKK